MTAFQEEGKQAVITYHEFGAERVADAIRIFESNGWDMYLMDRTKTLRAFERALLCLGAFDGERLVGLIRCSGDGEFTVNVEDLIVEAAYRRQHIGQKLLACVVQKFANVDMITLITDLNDQGVNDFYRSAGFQPYAEKALIGYAKQVRQ